MAKPPKKTVQTPAQPAAPTARTVRAVQESALVGRMRMLARAGIQFGGKRDIYAVAGYPAQENVSFDDYWALYKRNELAGRIVDMPAKSTWRTPPDILEPDGKSGTAFTDAFDALADRLKLWRHFERVDRLAGVGRYAILLLGVRGVEDRQLAQPMQAMAKPEDLIYLGVYHERNAPIKSWITNTGDPKFGLPQTYQVQLSSGVSGFPKASAQIHASRCLHVAEDMIEDEVFGRPRLERVVNRLFDMDKIAASVGEAFWQHVVRILQAKIDPAAEMDADTADALEEKMAEIMHDLRRQFMGKGTELAWLGTDVVPPKDIADFYFALLASGAGIPRRILFGNEAGDLASSTDQATYFGMISERQEQFAEPQIVRAFVDRLIELRALPQPQGGPDAYEIQWPTLFELTELEQADANLKRAQTAAALTPMGGDPTQLVEIDEEGNVWLVQKDPGDPASVGGGQPAGAGVPVDPNAPPLPGGTGAPPPPPAANRFRWEEGDLIEEGGNGGAPVLPVEPSAP